MTKGVGDWFHIALVWDLGVGLAGTSLEGGNPNHQQIHADSANGLLQKEYYEMSVIAMADDVTYWFDSR